jgi:anti-anti-sigma factor
MLNKQHGVRVYPIAGHMTGREQEALLTDLAIYAETERPRLVLNCSQILKMDRAAIGVLLSCLEVAMKCNGDVRLAALHPTAEAILRHTGMIHLFEIYATPEAAIRSFNQRSYSIVGKAESSLDRARSFTNAA